jgi:RNA polymerase sigma factor (sigma-70 family)
VGSEWTRKQRTGGSGKDAFPRKANPNKPAGAQSAEAATDRDGPSLGQGRGGYGRRIPLTDEQRLLAVQYLPMARSIANRFRTQWRIERDELQATAYMALVEAAQTFDPSRNVNFATYARHRIRGALRDCQRLLVCDGWRGDPALRPVYQRLGKDAERYGRVLGVEADRPVGARIESTDAVEDWLRRLPKAHAAACRLIYLDGKSQDEVAALVGVSKSYLSRLHQEALSWLIQDLRVERTREDPGPTPAPD